MKLTKYLTLCVMTTVAIGVTGRRMAPSQVVENDLQKRISATADKSQFAILNSPTLDGDRLEAMKFLYAYMLLPDLEAKDSTFWLANVDASLRAAREMPWGDQVPQREWQHFVLPVRINNEALDSARIVLYDELRDRVGGIEDMERAILEVNHWCHEKVSYRPSDGRTSPPLSTLSQAIGRCGEESTFTVAALRAIGIPARQVYTPRWAHTDDNHAWVEAWANGRWHFIGACEPEPVLDLAWFNAPASRGMMMTTNVFGRYDGPEEKLEVREPETVINVTSNYAPTAPVSALVRDEKGGAVAGAKVNFCLYNYADFYPVSSKITDTGGVASTIAGKGDMVVWATDGRRFGLTKVTVGRDAQVIVTLDKGPDYNGTVDFDLTPPPLSAQLPGVTESQREENNKRLAAEDAVRNYYISTFATEDDARRVASPLGFPADRIAPLIAKSRGNSRCLMDVMLSMPEADETLANLLESVSEKDLRDITTEVIKDNLAFTPPSISPEHHKEYVLNPRVSTEPLVPYKSFFRSVIAPEDVEKYRRDPSLWEKQVAEMITIDGTWNPRSIAMTPQGVWRQRTADAHSRDIFFVTSARSMGIPARIDPVTGKTQYADASGAWRDAFTSGTTGKRAPTGKVKFSFTRSGRISDPRYYSQFAISRIRDGVPTQMEYDEEMTLNDMAAATPSMDCGQYMLVTGQRMADGSVLARSRFFTIDKGKTTSVPVEIRQDEEGVQVIGSLNAENIYHDLNDNTDRSILSHTGRGYFIIGLIAPSNEPTAHALNDISSLKQEFEASGIPILLLFADAGAASRFDASPYTSLPKTAIFGVDVDGKSLEELKASLSLPDGTMPVFVIADSFNRVIFASQGYTIGLGEKLLDVLSKL